MLFIIFFHSSFSILYATCTYDNDNGYKINLNENNKVNSFAFAQFDDHYDDQGYGHFIIETNPIFNNESTHVMFCVGYLEGYLLQSKIYQNFQLFKDTLSINRENEFPYLWKNWMNENIKFIRSSILNKSQYWSSVSLILSQFDGLLLGYNDASPNSKKISEVDLWILQSMNEIDNLKLLWNKSIVINENSFKDGSGLIYIKKDFSDVFIGKSHWDDYRKMHNIIKEYNIDIKEWDTKHIEVSTKPGIISNCGNIYYTSNGLIILETSIGQKLNFNFESEISSHIILYWIRSLHASWTSSSCKQWIEEFLEGPNDTLIKSGQILILDSKALWEKTINTPEKDLLWRIFFFFLSNTQS